MSVTFLLRTVHTFSFDNLKETFKNLLVAEDSVSCSWPGLSPLSAGAEDEATVKALEAVDVVILQLFASNWSILPLFPACLVQSPDPGGLGLTLLWLNWQLAASAHQGEHPDTRTLSRLLIWWVERWQYLR